MVINYRILGDLSQVESAVIEIRNDVGEVVFTQNVPVQAEGQLIWEAGQPMTPTPNELLFRVKNPDGTVSGFVHASPEISFGATPTPILTEITPARIVAGPESRNRQIVLKGRNFTTGSRLIFQRADTEEITDLATQFVNSGELRVILPDAITSQPQSGMFMVVNGRLASQGKQLKVVVPGLPDAPDLTAIEPVRLPSSHSPSDTWITLRGTNFVDGDTLVIANAFMGRMRTEFVSGNELRALVPRFWLTGPGMIDIRVESAQDSDLASGDITLEILNTINAVLPPVRTFPVAKAVNDGYVPILPFGATGDIPVEITGINFVPGSRVEAVIGRRVYEFTPYEISETALSILVPAAQLRARAFQTSLSLIMAQTAASSVGQTNSSPAFTAQNEFTFVCFGDMCALNSGYHWEPSEKDADGNIQGKLYVMVPMDGNKTLAAVNVDPWQNIVYTVSHPELVEVIQITSEFPRFTHFARETEIFSVIGKGQRLDDRTITLQAFHGDSLLDEARLYLMPTREYNVNVHFVRPAIPDNIGIDPDHPAFTPARMPGNQGEADALLADLNRKVNDILMPQTNARFNFRFAEPKGGQPGSLLSIVDYSTRNAVVPDPDPDEKDPALDKIRRFSGVVYPDVPEDASPEDIEKANRELLNIITSIGNTNIAAPTGWSPQTANEIHLYFVTNFLYFSDGSDMNSLGFAWTNLRHAFIRDGVPTDQFIATIAHELGHSIGLYHTEELTVDKLNVNKSIDDEPYTAFDASEPDSKFEDYRKNNFTLMWGLESPPGVGNHIGFPHWRQINAANPE
jgi:hypothetical protein